MNLQGLQKLTLLDFPGKVACTVFTYGCNFLCPFCHNSRLVTRAQNEGLTEAEFFSYLEKRRGILDGVCVSGGEPLMHNAEDFIKKIKSMGFAVKLDTNGSFPEKLRHLTENSLVDYVAMDIKNSPHFYAETCGKEINIDAIYESIDILLRGKTDYEFRTTVVREFHNEQRLIEAAGMIKGAKQYFLQGFIDSGELIGQDLHGFTGEEMEQLKKAVCTVIPNTQLRGI